MSLETSGALGVEKVPAAVVKVLDLKTPGSNESHRNLWTNLQYLTPQDQIKFVVCNRGDYDWARMRCDEYDLYERVRDVLFSPSHHELAPRDSGLIVSDRLPVRMQMQMHKLFGAMCPVTRHTLVRESQSIMKKAVILVSGGLDSATVLAIAQATGYACYAVSFDYGQRHRAELEAARQVATRAGVVEHRIVSIDLSQFGGSALTDETIDVPEANASQDDIPVTMCQPAIRFFCPCPA